MNNYGLGRDRRYFTFFGWVMERPHGLITVDLMERVTD